MRHIPACIVLVVLASLTLLSPTPVAQGKDAIQWLKGSKNFGVASEKATDEKKFLLLDFFHPH
ncbi:MAG: hypothetical protein ACE5IC_09340 [Candidatus Brocadiales bacterium]